MAAEAIGGQQRTLQVHRAALFQRAQRGQGQRLVRHIRGPTLRIELDHGQAAAADRDRFAQGDVVRGHRAPGKAQALIAAAGFAGDQAADGLDQASEHGVRLGAGRSGGRGRHCKRWRPPEPRITVPGDATQLSGSVRPGAAAPWAIRRPGGVAPAWRRSTPSPCGPLRTGRRPPAAPVPRPARPARWPDATGTDCPRAPAAERWPRGPA